MSDIDVFEWVMDGESFVKVCVDILCISEFKIFFKEDSFWKKMVIIMFVCDFLLDLRRKWMRFVDW